MTSVVRVLIKNQLKSLQLSLKAVDTIGNFQRLASTVGVSQHMHKITCENFSSIGHRSCEIIMK